MELLRDRSGEFEAAGVRPLGISRDSPWTHISWMQALDLDFGLLSDWNAEAEFLAGGAPGHGEAAPGDYLQTAYRLWLVGHQLERGAAPWRDPYTFRPEAPPGLNPAGWPFGLPY